MASFSDIILKAGTFVRSKRIFTSSTVFAWSVFALVNVDTAVSSLEAWKIKYILEIANALYTTDSFD